MAAGSFTASVILEAQYRLDQMFAEPNTAMTEMLAGEAAAARALLPRQTAQTLERTTGGYTVGAEVWFLRPGATDLDSGDWPADNDCDVPAGTEGETVKADIATSILAYSTGKTKTNRSDNLITAEEEMAKTMAHICARLRYQLNRDILISGLEAVAQANLDANINATWDYTTNTPRIVVPEADFSWENLNEFRIVAKNNNFSDFFFLSGRLFNDNVWLAGLNRGNEGFRNEALAWAERQIVFDERDLDDVLGRKSALAIDVNSYAFWNMYRSSASPEVVEGTNYEIWKWAVPDPTGLVWNKNGVLTPVVYEFEMQVACTGRDAFDFHQASRTMAGRLIGGFETAPEGPNAETGVLLFAIS